MQIHALVFQAAPHAFNHHIVAPASLALHGNMSPGSLQGSYEAIAGKLADLIRSETVPHTGNQSRGRTAV